MKLAQSPSRMTRPTLLVMTVSALLLMTLSAFLWASDAGAQSQPIRLPDYERTELDNGLRVAIMPLKGLPLVDFLLVVGGGAVADPPDKSGLSHLTAELLTKGTTTRNALEIAEEIEFVGGELGASVEYERIRIEGEFLSEDLDLALDLLADVVLNPVFSAEEVDRQRALVLGEIENDKDQPSVIANRMFRKALYGENPFGLPIQGTRESVTALRRRDVKEFHSRHFTPDNAFLIVVGDVDLEQARTAIAERFGDWKGSHVESDPIQPPLAIQGRRVIVVDKPDVTQTQIRFGNLGIRRNDPDYFAVQVANTVLGSGFTSRLINEIRVNRGLSYTVNSRFVSYRENGYFRISTFTKNPTTREIIDVALEVLEDLRTNGMGEEELQAAKNYRKGLFPLNLETPEDLASMLANIEFYDLPRDYVASYWQNIDAVTHKEVMRVLDQHFAFENLLFVVVSNPETATPQLESLGKLEVWPLE